MSLERFSLALRILLGSLALVFVWLLVLQPWLLDRGQSPPRLLTVLMSAAVVSSSLWLGLGLYRAAVGLRMAVFRIRYTLDEGTLPPGFAQFLENLAQEAGHMVVSFLHHKGHLGLYIEAPEGYAPSVWEAIRHPDVLGGECQQLPGPLAVRPLRSYAVVCPPRTNRSALQSPAPDPGPTPTGARPIPSSLPAPVRTFLEKIQRRLEPTASAAPSASPAAAGRPAAAPLGQALLETLLQGGNGELRWHLRREGRGLVTIAVEKPEAFRRWTGLPATVRRLPRPVWTVPQRLGGPLARLLDMLRHLYWWCPVYADWGSSLARQLWLPASARYPDLDAAQVRFAPPSDYQPGRPLLILGHTADEHKRPAGMTLAEGAPSHLLIAGGGSANEPLGLALVEQAIRLGCGVLAIGDHFDGLGIVFNNLPEEKRERVARISPLAETPPHISLLNPQAAPQDGYPEAQNILVRFLEAEGITLTANREAVWICQAAAAAALRGDPDFDLATLAGLLDQPETVRSLLQSGDLGDCPVEVRAFVEQAPDLPDWKIKSYAALVGQRLVILNNRVTRPPYVNLAGLLGQGGGLFCSLPLQQGGGVGASSAQLARYIVYAVLHLAKTCTLPRPLLLYLGDFPRYLTSPLPWDELRLRNCLVALSSPSIPEEALALLPPSLPAGRFASLALAPAFPERDRFAALLALPSAALGRLRGRNAVLQHLYRGRWLTCAVDVLDRCPPGVAEEFPLAESAAGEEPLDLEDSRGAGEASVAEEWGRVGSRPPAAAPAREQEPADPVTQTRARLQRQRYLFQELYVQTGGRVEAVGDLGFPELPEED